MKFCPDCGKKLAQPNPKFCPNCGGRIAARRAVSAPAAGGEQGKAPLPSAVQAQPRKAEAKPKAPDSPRARIARIAIYLLLPVVFLAIALVAPLAYWYQAEKAGAQYYQYYAAFQKDTKGLEFLSKQYDNLTLNNVTLGLKARMAGNYALRAKQSLVSWAYFQSFMGQNEGPLQSWNASTLSAKSEMNESNSTIRKTATAMRIELDNFAGADQTKAGEVSSALSALREVAR